MTPDIPAIFEAFKNATVLVVGDVMMDVYLFGKVDRISPEAPVPVVELQKEELRLGGAANVALNLKALGARAMLCSVIGEDSEAYELEGLMKDEGLTTGFMFHSKRRITTKKTRILSRGQQMLRFDHEVKDPLSKEDTAGLLDKFKNALQKKPQVVVLQDYNKGVLTPHIIETIIAQCNELGIPVVVDPKKDNFLAYKGAHLFKPNLKEVREALAIDVDPQDLVSLKSASDKVQEAMGNDLTLITLSADGVYITDHETHIQIPAMLRKVADVSGAGDTVISVAALCVAQQMNMRLLATLSNMAGGLVCEKVGVAPIDAEHFLDEARRCLEN